MGVDRKVHNLNGIDLCRLSDTGEDFMCNDDENDNRFYEPIGRLPEIEEDEEPYRLLCNEYPEAK